MRGSVPLTSMIAKVWSMLVPCRREQSGMILRTRRSYS